MDSEKTTINGLNLKNVMTNLMGLDDTFNFHCTACGKCCHYREDILLSPLDLFRISTYLKRQPIEIFARYCEVYEGSSTHFPIVRLLPTPPDQRCPFLRGKKCAIHAAKPTICFLFPLARVFQPGENETKYYRLPDVACGNENRTVTVREWIGTNYNEEYEECGKLWSDFLCFYSNAMHLKWPKLSKDIQDEILSTAFLLLYLSCDTRTSFAPQLRQMLSRFTAFLATKIDLSDIPEWMEVEDVSDKGLRQKLILYKAYGLYKKECCERRGEDYTEKMEAAEKEGLYSSLEDFSRKEFQDPAWLHAHLPESTVNFVLND